MTVVIFRCTTLGHAVKSFDLHVLEYGQAGAPCPQGGIGS